MPAEFLNFTKTRQLSDAKINKKVRNLWIDTE